MKKFITLIFLLTLSVSLIAQRSASTTGVPWTTGFKALTMLPVDSVTQGGTAYWVFDVGYPQKSYFYCFSVALTLISTNTNRYAITVDGSMDATNYVASGITQVNCFPTAGGGADTTLKMASVTTPVLWRYLKLKVVGNDCNVKGVKVSGLSLKAAYAY